MLQSHPCRAVRLFPGLPLLLLVPLAAAQPAPTPPSTDLTLRVAVFELGGLPTADLGAPDHPRLKRLAEVLQRLRPNILLLSGIAFDTPAATGASPGANPASAGQNGQRFADLYLARPQAEGLAPLRYRPFSAAPNSGFASGLDLDHNGRVVTTFSPPGSAPAPEYSADCWAPGDYPGQHGMCLLVDDRLTILADKVRSFRRFPWSYMPGARLPQTEEGQPWHTAAERSLIRLSSAGHWDVPVALPNGAVLHILCSRPIPPAAAPSLAARRNHDEIRFWADYAEDAAYLVDDAGVPGGIASDQPFVILGSFGVAPALGNPDSVISGLLFAARRINSSITPAADLTVETLDATATSFDNLRADYVLPSRDLGIAAAGVWRHPPAGPDPSFPSRHFPVWTDLVVPAPPAPPRPRQP